MPVKEWRTKETMQISVAGRWPGTDKDYELEGTVVAHFLKGWNPDEERYVPMLVYWHDVESFVVKFGDGAEEFYLSEQLPDEVAGEVEWLIQQSLD